MHIPDNYLSPSTCATFGVVMIPIWRKAVKNVKEQINRKKMPLIGLCSAFSFLVMMFNVPVPGGTTAHAVGASLIAILLGPSAAILSVTITLLIQALLFGDGGLLSFGANAFNMAFVIPVTAYYIYRFIKGNSKSEKRDFVSAFIAGYISINIAAMCAAIEFGIQPILFKDANGMPLYSPYSIKTTLWAMMIPHLLVVGFIEGSVCGGVLAYLRKVSPKVVVESQPIKFLSLKFLIVLLMLLCPIGLIASGSAFGEWGNDQIKSMLGYLPKGMQQGFSFKALFSSYSIHGISSIIGYIICGIIGVVAILIIFKLIGKQLEKNIDDDRGNKIV
jgi:cobalt/nickel transport system permease protein